MTTPMASAPKQLETKWTRGPWLVQINAESDIGRTHSVYVCDARGWPEGQLARVNTQDGFREREANARLIACAPEMADELQFVRGLLAHSGAESGYCMCGDPVDSHNIGSGHAPIDSHAYYASEAVERIDAILAKIGVSQ